MTFEELDEFNKDLKKLSKRYRTLDSDLNTVRKALTVRPHARPPISFEIDGLKIETCVIKIKKIACKALKGKGNNTGLRLIYAHFKEENRIVFIELYHKNDKDIEDKERIKNNFK